jgi:hypothetical protein
VAIAYVNGDAISSSGSSTTIATTTGINVTAGNAVLVFVSNYTTGGVAVSSISHLGSGSFTKKGTTYGGDANHKMECWICPNCGAYTGDKFTVNFAANATYKVLCVVQYSGMDQTNPYDTEASGKLDGTSETSHPTNTLTAADNDLVVGYFVTWSTSKTFSNGTSPASNLRIASGQDGCVQDVILTTGGSSKGVSCTTNETTQLVSICLAFKVAGGGGGTAYDRTIPDSLGFSESPSRITAAKRSTPDNLGTSNSWSRSATANRATPDNLGASNGVNRLFAGTRSTPDNLGFSDAPSRRVAALRQLLDNLGTADAPSSKMNWGRLAIDNLGASDAASRLAAAKRLISDSLGNSDSALRVSAALRSYQDSLGMSNSASRLVAAIRMISDSLGMANDKASTMNWGRVAADSLGHSDSMNRTTAAKRSLADYFGGGDGMDRSTAAYRSVADALGLSDLGWGSTGAGPKLILALDYLGTSNEILRRVTASRSIADSLGLADAIARSVAARRAWSDYLGLADLAWCLGAGPKTILAMDSLGLSDLFGRQVLAHRALVDYLGAANDYARAVVYRRYVADSLGCGDNAAVIVATLVIITTAGVEFTLPRSRPHGTFAEGLTQATFAKNLAEWTLEGQD